MMAAREDGGGGTGSARRRRERRLRAHLKYARTTVPPPEPELFDLFEEPNRVRPNLLLEPHGVQDQLQRHRVEQALDVPVLHVTRDEVDEREYDIMEEVVQQLVPQEQAQLRTVGEDGAALVSGLLDGLEKLVLQERVQPRTGEQAHVHFLGLLHRVQQRTAEQVVHVPLGTVSESLVEQVVDVVMPGVFHVPQQRVQQRSEQVVDVHVPLATVSERNVEQVVDVATPSVELVSVQDPQLERPPTRAAASSLDAPQEHFDWFFALFPNIKKVQQKCWQNQ